MRRLWSAEDDARLVALSRQMPIKDVARALGRSLSATQRRLWQVRPGPRVRRKLWTEAEHQDLLESAGSEPLSRIAARLGRTTCACQAQLNRHGVTQRGAQGRFAIPDLSAALGVGAEMFKVWRQLGLRMFKGPRVSRGVMRMVEIEHLIAFVKLRPEAVDPDGCSPRLLAPMCLTPRDFVSPYKYKRKVCLLVNRHPTRAPIEWWPPLRRAILGCPCCGLSRSQWADGEPGERYSVTPVELPLWAGVSSRAWSMMCAIAAGQVTSRQLEGGPLERGHFRGISVLRRLLRKGLVKKTRSGIENVYSITAAGVVVMEEINARRQRAGG